MKQTNYARSLVMVVAAVTAVEVLALKPQPMRLADGVTLTPTLDLSEAYDDNIYEANVVADSSSWVTTVAPDLLLDVLNGTHHYQLQYSFQSDFFHSDRDNDNTDHFFRAGAYLGLDSNNRLDFDASHNRVENIFDTSVIGENDKFETTNASGVYGFGTASAPFNVDVGVNHTWYRTFNSGGINRDREYDKPGARITGYYRIAPKTRLLAEYRYDQYDYLLTSSRLDSDKDTLLVGVTWAATARTLGTLKFGQERRDFDDSALDDRDGSSWEADLTWQPAQRSTLVFNSSKGTDEGSATEELIEATRLRVSWNQQLSPRMSSDVFYAYADEDYQDLIGREDEINEFGASVRYEFARWMDIGLGYTYKDRDSNIPVRAYDRNIFLLKLNLSL